MLSFNKVYRLASIHVLAGRTGLPIYGHQRSQIIPALPTRACVLRSKSHMLTFSRGCDAYAVICCDTTYGNRERWMQKRFSVPRKKSKTKEQLYNKDFWKIVFSNSIADLHTSKCKRPHNRPKMVAYENRHRNI